MEVMLKWECKVTESSSLSVADSFAYTVGFKALQEVEMKPKVIGAQAGSMKTGVELSFAFSGTYSITTGWHNTKEDTFAIEQKVTIPTGEGLVNQASYTTLQVTEIPWSGHVSRRKCSHSYKFIYSTPHIFLAYYTLLYLSTIVRLPAVSDRGRGETSLANHPRGLP